MHGRFSDTRTPVMMVVVMVVFIVRQVTHDLIVFYFNFKEA